MSNRHVRPEDWITHDPDPKTAAELAACNPDQLAKRFAHPLTFGTGATGGRGGQGGVGVAGKRRDRWL
jgi:phosphomannomutase